jgi:hypothetical protein
MEYATFWRPITKEENALIYEYAPTEIYRATGDSPFNLLIGFNDEYLYERLMKSYNENIPCVYGRYWFEYNYGTDNPALKDIQGKVGYIKREHNFFARVDEYCNVLPIKEHKNYFYSCKIIHNKRELRRYLGKRYFTLSGNCLAKISEFFRKYRGGVIII